MIIRNFSQRDDGELFFVESDVDFETQARSQRVFFAVPSTQAAWLSVRPDAFMLGAAMAAMWAGEPRLKIEAAVDPQLAQRLSMAMRLTARWWDKRVKPVRIEALPPPAAAAAASQDKQTGIFLSGGIDSLAALVWNVQQYPLGHPRRVSVAFFVYGFDVGDPNKPGREDIFELARKELDNLCRSLGVELVPVWVNFRSLGADWRLYENWQFASLLAAIAHAAGHRLSQIIIASDNVIEYVQRHGSHPWLNSYYSSDTLRLSTGDSEQFTRLQRVRIVVEHGQSFKALRVCFAMDKIPQGKLNCGTCSKCVRTMLELVACGAPQAAVSAFSARGVTLDLLKKSTRIDYRQFVEYYEELPGPLHAVGRSDLARTVQLKLWAWKIRQALGLNWLRPRLGRLLTHFRG